MLGDNRTVSEKVLSVLVANPDKWMTRRQVSKGSGVAKSPTLIAALWALHDAAVIEWRNTSRYNDGFVHEYRITSDRLAQIDMFHGSEV